MKTIFMGTPQFAVPSLQWLANSLHKPSLVVTQPDKPQGRRRKIQSPPLKLHAQKLDIPVFQPENINQPENLEKIARLEPDLIITVAYGGYLKKTLRNLPTFKSINLHPSLLPLYRGAAPINYALFNGAQKTGITIFQLTARMDAGPILWQREIEIREDDNYTSLSQRLAVEGAKDLLHTVNNIEQLFEKKVSQNESQATYSHKIEKQDKLIDWKRKSVEILNQIRGLAEFPGAVTGFRKKQIKIIEAELADGSGEPGSVITVNRKGIIIAAADGCLLVKKVQPAGKKIMSASAFDLGARIKPGEKFTNGN